MLLAIIQFFFYIQCDNYFSFFSNEKIHISLHIILWLDNNGWLNWNNQKCFFLEWHKSNSNIHDKVSILRTLHESNWNSSYMLNTHPRSHNDSKSALIIWKVFIDFMKSLNNLQFWFCFVYFLWVIDHSFKFFRRSAVYFLLILSSLPHPSIPPSSTK